MVIAKVEVKGKRKFAKEDGQLIRDREGRVEVGSCIHPLRTYAGDGRRQDTGRGLHLSQVSA